eukprot:TRINITY_DN17314_c0_g1_i1.p5 TRINITY_DN17314_c0_g1~~TRINITY_DN17314_c0_g1_i1.p5  ORF type:complete len:105 (-),score=11.65 TRINITY_DN17314_c0_g1_i1:38-352(-)
MLRNFYSSSFDFSVLQLKYKSKIGNSNNYKFDFFVLIQFKHGSKVKKLERERQIFGVRRKFGDAFENENIYENYIQKQMLCLGFKGINQMQILRYVLKVFFFFL